MKYPCGWFTYFLEIDWVKIGVFSYHVTCEVASQYVVPVVGTVKFSGLQLNIHSVYWKQRKRPIPRLVLKQHHHVCLSADSNALVRHSKSGRNTQNVYEIKGRAGYIVGLTAHRLTHSVWSLLIDPSPPLYMTQIITTLACNDLLCYTKLHHQFAFWIDITICIYNS